MPQMYCPQCGRELELDSGEIRFCRYCGFALTDTKEALHGYSEKKRIGFSIVTWSYALLLAVTLLLHGGYVSLDTRWVYWLLTALIVASVSFFVSAAASALKPAMFSQSTRRDKQTPGLHADTPRAQRSLGAPERSLLQRGAPITDLSSPVETREREKEPRSVIEGTTKSLNDRDNRE